MQFFSCPLDVIACADLGLVGKSLPNHHHDETLLASCESSKNGENEKKIPQICRTRHAEHLPPVMSKVGPVNGHEEGRSKMLHACQVARSCSRVGLQCCSSLYVAWSNMFGQLEEYNHRQALVDAETGLV